MEVGARRGRSRAAVLPFPHPPSLSRFRAADLLPSGRALLIGFALIAATVLAYFGARATSMFALTTVDVRGAPPLVSAHVRQALRPLRGKSLLALSADDVTQRLERLPDVASVSYDRDFPHTLRLRISPAHTIAVVRQGGSAWLVASDERVIRTAARTAAPRLPRVWVPREADLTPGQKLSGDDVSTAVRAIADARRAGFADHVFTVRASSDELTFVLANHFELRFGDASDLAAKVAVARRIVPRAVDYGYVDVSVPDRSVAGGKSQLSD
jgi:cell division protein FtsQ